MEKMNPQARATVSIVLAIALLVGYLNRVGLSVASIIEKISDGSFGLKASSITISVVMLIVAWVVVLVAGQAVRAAGEPWVVGLAQAARVIAIIAMAIYALNFVADVIGGGIYSSLNGISLP
jgi:hypothetical protein